MKKTIEHAEQLLREHSAPAIDAARRMAARRLEGDFTVERLNAFNRARAHLHSAMEILDAIGTVLAHEHRDEIVAFYTEHPGGTR